MTDRSDRSVAVSFAARTSSPPEPDCDCPDGFQHLKTCVVVTGANPFCIDPGLCGGGRCPRDPVCGN